MVRTDMAAESVARASDAVIGGVSSQETVNEQAGLRIERIHIFTQEAARLVGKAIGRGLRATAMLLSCARRLLRRRSARLWASARARSWWGLGTEI